MNAVTTTLLTFTRPGDRIILTKNCYRNTRKFCTSVLAKLGIEIILIDTASEAHFRQEFEQRCREKPSRFIDALKIPFMGTNFGSTVTMVEQCATFTYYQCSDVERQQLGITDNLVRLSVGHEDVNMLLADLDAALLAIKQRSAEVQYV